jgi:DNA (cytosine-5)-methyltransferase 1
LDAQFFGVPQRRRRVFFVGHFGEPFTAPAEVLFELESGGGDSASGSQTGQGVTGSTAWGAGVASRTGGGASSNADGPLQQGVGPHGR